MIRPSAPHSPQNAPPGLGGHPWQWLASLKARRRRAELLRALDAHIRDDIGLPPPSGLPHAQPPRLAPPD